MKCWLDGLALFRGPGASPTVCELLEEEGDRVPTGPPLAELLASDAHQQQVEALRRALASAYALADAYKEVCCPSRKNDMQAKIQI